MNDYYTHTTFPSFRSSGSSSSMRAELDLIDAGFAKLPTLTGNGNKFVLINSGGTAQTVSSLLREVSGAIGIGTNSPASRLHVSGGDVLLDNGYNYSIKTSGGTASGVLQLDGSNNLLVGPGGSTNSVQIATGGTARVVVESTGNLAMSMSSGQSRFVGTSAGFGGAIRLAMNGSTSGDRGVRIGYRDNTTAFSYALAVEENDVLITAATTPPTLAVNQQMVFNLTSNTNLRISVRGTDGTTRTTNLTLS